MEIELIYDIRQCERCVKHHNNWLKNDDVTINDVIFPQASRLNEGSVLHIGLISSQNEYVSIRVYVMNRIKHSFF